VGTKRSLDYLLPSPPCCPRSTKGEMASVAGCVAAAEGPGSGQCPGAAPGFREAALQGLKQHGRRQRSQKERERGALTFSNQTNNTFFRNEGQLFTAPQLTTAASSPTSTHRARGLKAVSNHNEFLLNF